MANVDLRISRNIIALTETAREYTPAANSLVTIRLFAAEGLYTTNSACKLVWKFNHPTEPEQILWLIRGSGTMPEEITIPREETDGIRKLAITADNGELNTVPLAVWARVKIKPST